MLGAFADLASERNKASRAARLWGAAETLREALDTPLSPSELPDYNQAVARTLTDLGEADFNLAKSEGRAFTMDHAIDYALEDQE